jgi:hypothetical protein
MMLRMLRWLYSRGVCLQGMLECVDFGGVSNRNKLSDVDELRDGHTRQGIVQILLGRFARVALGAHLHHVCITKEVVL